MPELTGEGLSKVDTQSNTISGWRDAWDTKQYINRGHRELEGTLVEAQKVPVPEEVLQAYEKHREVITTIYGADHVNPNLLYHGTGAIQFAGDKYRSGITTEHRKPLDTILTEGIIPHHDKFKNREKGGVDTTSFATAWHYAKYYADRHQSPADPLLWEYGDTAVWTPYYWQDTHNRTRQHPLAAARHYAPRIHTIANEFIQTMRGAENEKNMLYKFRQWISYVRDDVTSNTPTVEVIRGRTTIPDNFGAIITIDKGNIALFDMGQNRGYEIRTTSKIAPDGFRSLAVPLDKTEEYGEKLRELGLAVPVLPTEAVEYHMSQFPFRELTTDRRAA